MAQDSEKFTLIYGFKCQRLKYLPICISFRKKHSGPVTALILLQTEPQKFSYCPAHQAATTSFRQEFRDTETCWVLGAETISDEKRWREEKGSVPRWSEAQLLSSGGHC